MRWLVVLFALSVAVIADAKPERPVPPKKASKQQYPDLNYTSNWGKITIDRDTGAMLFRGHPDWDGEAQFVTATKVYVIWWWKADNSPAPGIYDFKDGRLVGVWNFDKDIFIDTKTWEASGVLIDDVVYDVANPPADLPGIPD
jgi:hypothetical protein